jgi:hypothetical protein
MTLIMAPSTIPSPNTIARPGVEMGGWPATLVLDPLLVVRQSTAPPPAGGWEADPGPARRGARAVDPGDRWRPGSCRNVAAKHTG